MEALLGPDGLLVLAVLVATLAFAWNVRERRASGMLLLAGSAALFCGILSAALTSAYVVVAIANRMGADSTARIAWARKLVIAGVPYDMHLYSTLLLAGLIVVLAVRCIRSANAVVIGAKDGWKTVVRADLLLLTVSVPLIPLQPFALFLAVAAFFSLESAFAARRDLTTLIKRRSRMAERIENRLSEEATA